MGLFKKKSAVAPPPAGCLPVLRASICTGEKVAGWRDAATGALYEETLIRTAADLQAFLRRWGLQESDLHKEW